MKYESNCDKRDRIIYVEMDDENLCDSCLGIEESLILDYVGTVDLEMRNKNE